MSSISILTPSYNYEWCIEDALLSVAEAARHVRQGGVIEHVVADDGSTDGTPALLERLQAPIRLEHWRGNRGQSATLNRCLKLATGEWIGWLNADDFFLPLSLVDASEAINDTVDVVYGDAVMVDIAGRFLRLMPEHAFSLWTLRWWGTFLPVGAVFLRRALMLELGWREDLKLLLDWDLWLRAAELGAKFAYVPKPLSVTRIHPGQESKQQREGRLAEKSRVRKEHGLPSRPFMWRFFQRLAAPSHAMRKMASGGFARQIRSSRFRGAPMRWFREPAGWLAVSSLYRHVYDDDRMADLR